MKGFVYNGKSTEDILTVPLILATFNFNDSIQGVSKTDNLGNQTITRETPNEYGTINTLPSFQYGLIKSDRSVFTDEEQRIVEAWLTSPLYSQELYLFDFQSVVCSLSNDVTYNYVDGKSISSISDSMNQTISYEYDSKGKLIKETDGNGNTITYSYTNGLLTSSTDKFGVTNYFYDNYNNLTKIVYPNGDASYYEYDQSGRLIKSLESNYEKLAIIDLANQNYFYKGRFTETNWYIAANGWAGLMFTFNCATAYPYRKYYHTYDISGDTNVKINCQTDALNSYVYPTVRFTNNTDTSSGLVKDFNFVLKSKTDNNNELKAIVQPGITIAFDCQNCIPWKYLVEDNNGSRNECLYSDLGWSDVGNIYWARLSYGNNDWIVSGNGKLTVQYNAPYKIIGGWL